jgi:hypothetical protein
VQIESREKRIEKREEPREKINLTGVLTNLQMSVVSLVSIMGLML